MVDAFQTITENRMAAWAFVAATLSMWAFVAYLLAVV